MISLLVVSAVDRVARECGVMSLLMGLPGAVLVRHELTADDDGGEGGVIRRIVSDDSGIVEDETAHLDHACLSCTARQDIVPTLRRLAEDGRWQSVVLAPPLAAAPEPIVWQIVDAIEHDALPVHLASVLSIVDEERIVEDAFGDDLVAERGLGLGDRDARSVAEALADQMDYSDLVCTLDPPDGVHASAMQHLVSPTRHVTMLSAVNPEALLRGKHDLRAAKRRLDPVRTPAVEAEDGDGFWSCELVSDRPFHPERLMNDLELLGGGAVRVRGCFQIPTRPSMVCALHAAGSQVALGSAGLWGHRRPQTRLVIQGQGSGTRGRVARAFTDLLMTDFEMRDLHRWRGVDDLLDDWFGPQTREAG